MRIALAHDERKDAHVSRPNLAGAHPKMPALKALKELTSELALAGSAEDIGRALFVVAKRFDFQTALVVDMTKLFNRIGPAIVYATIGRDKVEGFYSDKHFPDTPFAERARRSEQPFKMSSVRAERGRDDESWWSQLPPHLKDTDGLVVPVHHNGELAWYCGFAGRDPDLSQGAQSVMAAAAHAAYARFNELLDSTAARSPLTTRESECLRWVASGKTDNEVGQILKISPRTVRFHINNAKTKLGVATRIQAVAKRMSGAA